DVPSPKMVEDYHKIIGDVDVHDQLRLQRFPSEIVIFLQNVLQRVLGGSIVDPP
ncbi:hypothetical protein PHYSODRAFT_528674, partial [Phytophthora sojae]